MSSESKKRKIMSCYKKVWHLVVEKENCGRHKGVNKFSSSQRRKEERKWKKEMDRFFLING